MVQTNDPVQSLLQPVMERRRFELRAGFTHNPPQHTQVNKQSLKTSEKDQVQQVKKISLY